MYFATNLEILDLMRIFNDEVAARGGSLTEFSQDLDLIFARAVLPETKDVQPGDAIQGGVALKIWDQKGVWLYPYLVRHVCVNGAILTLPLEEVPVNLWLPQDTDSAVESLREAIRSCCAPSVFQKSVAEIQKAIDTPVLMFPELPQFMNALSVAMPASAFHDVLRTMREHRLLPVYELANQVTAIARETKSPRQKWDLEELGGGLLVCRVPTRPPGSGAAALRQWRPESVAQGDSSYESLDPVDSGCAPTSFS